MSGPSPSRYRVIKHLSRGGVGEVLEALVEGEGGFERRVAIKRLLEEHAGDPTFLASFLDEARIASQLHHANVVAVFDYGVMDERPFLVMELIDGVDLIGLESAAKAAAQKMTIAIALHIVVEVGHALHYAHNAKDARGRSMRIVHRDVSPENILVSWEGDIKLTDFGIARAKRRLEETSVGRAKGKLGYMAPEQAKGIDIDPRADLFSLGCVLHRLIAGRSPLDRVGEEELVRGRAEVDIDGAIPDDVRRIISRATKSERAERYANAAEMVEECGAAMARRLANDARTAMRQWIAPIRQHVDRESLRDETAAKPARNRMADLFALELIAQAEPEGPRRFASVAASTGITEKAPVPSSLEVATEPPEDATALGPSRPIAIPRAEELVAGAMVHGYQLVELIGHGGGSRVYRAFHPVLKRECAVKVLPVASENVDLEVAANRLRREATIVARLQHPNIISILDFGVTPDGATFMIMEHLAGRTLTEVIYDDPPLDARRTADLAHQIALALAAAHAAGLVHRDLKTDNVIVLDGDRVKVLDFGLAREYRADPELTSLTKSGMLLGTPAYMAPEQIRSPSTAGPKADLYSLGVILYEMLARRRPFEGHIVQVLGNHLRSPPPSLPHFGGLELLAIHLLQKDPAARPAGAKEVAEELARLAQGIDPVQISATDHTAVVADTAIVPPRAAAQMPVFVQAAIGGTALLVCVAAGVYLAQTLFSSQPVERRPEPEVAAPLVVPKPSVVSLPAEAPPPPAPEAPPLPKKPAAKSEPKPREEPAADRPSLPQTIEAGLKRVSTRIAAAQGTIPRAELDRLESRFFELQARAQTASTEAEQLALAKDVLALDRDVARAERAF